MKGSLRIEYQKLTDTSKTTATIDLRELEAMGYLQIKGQKAQVQNMNWNNKLAQGSDRIQAKIKNLKKMIWKNKHLPVKSFMI